MATYIQGLTGNAPQIQQFKPDHNFYQSVLTLKQNQYDQGLQQVSSLYGSALDVELTRSDNKQKKQEFFDQIEGGIKKLAGLDLSLKQNVEQAYGLFNQFLHDESIQHDAWFTKTSNDELARAEAFRKNCVDPEECGGEWWEGGKQLIQLSLHEYRDASLQDALTMQPEEFVPAQNVWKIATDIMKEIDPDKTVEYVTASKEFVVKDKNGDIVNDEVSALLTGILGSDPRIKEYYKAQAKLDRMKYVSMNKDKLGSSDIANAAYYGKKLQELNRSFNALILGTEISDENKGYVESLAVMQKELEQSLSENNFLINLAKAVSGDNTISIDQQVNDVFGKQENETPIQKDIRELFTKQQAILTSLNTINYLFEEAKRNGQYTQGYGTDIMDSYIGNMMLNLEINASMVEPLSNIWSIKQTKTAPGSRTRGRISGGSGSSKDYTQNKTKSYDDYGNLTETTTRTYGSGTVNNSSSSTGIPTTSSSRISVANGVQKYGGTVRIRKYQYAGEIGNNDNYTTNTGNADDYINVDLGKYGSVKQISPLPSKVQEENIIGNIIKTHSYDKSTIGTEADMYSNWNSYWSDILKTDYMKSKSDPLKKNIENQVFKDLFGITKEQYENAQNGIVCDEIYHANVNPVVYNSLPTLTKNLFFASSSDKNKCGHAKAGQEYSDGYGVEGEDFFIVSQKNLLHQKIDIYKNRMSTAYNELVNVLSAFKESNKLIDDLTKYFNYNEILYQLNDAENQLKNNQFNIPDLPAIDFDVSKMEDNTSKQIESIMNLLLDSGKYPEVLKFQQNVFDLSLAYNTSKELFDNLRNRVDEYINMYDEDVLSSNDRIMRNIKGPGMLSPYYNDILEKYHKAGGNYFVAGGGYFTQNLGQIFRENYNYSGDTDNNNSNIVKTIRNIYNYKKFRYDNTSLFLFSGVNASVKDLGISDDADYLSSNISNEGKTNTALEIGLKPVSIAAMVKTSNYSNQETDSQIHSQFIACGYNKMLGDLTENIKNTSKEKGLELSDDFNINCIDFDKEDNSRIVVDLFKDIDGGIANIKYKFYWDESEKQYKYDEFVIKDLFKENNFDYNITLTREVPDYNEEDTRKLARGYNRYTLKEEISDDEKKLLSSIADNLNKKYTITLNSGAANGVVTDLNAIMEYDDKRRDYEIDTRPWYAVIGKDEGKLQQENNENVSLSYDEMSRFLNFACMYSPSDIESRLSSELFENRNMSTFANTFDVYYPILGSDGKKLKSEKEDKRTELINELITQMEGATGLLAYSCKSKDGLVQYWPLLDSDDDPKESSLFTKEIGETIKQFKFENLDKNIGSVLFSPIVNNDQKMFGVSFVFDTPQGDKKDIYGYTFYVPYNEIEKTSLGQMYRDNALLFALKYSDGTFDLPASNTSSRVSYYRNNEGNWILQSTGKMYYNIIDNRFRGLYTKNALSNLFINADDNNMADFVTGVDYNEKLKQYMIPISFPKKFENDNEFARWIILYNKQINSNYDILINSSL